MTKKEVIILVSSVAAVLAYTLPFLFKKNDIIDNVYSVVTTLSIGCILVCISIKLTKISEFIQMVAGILFIGLSLMFLVNSICNDMFKTNDYVFAIIIISFTTWITILFKKQIFVAVNVCLEFINKIYLVITNKLTPIKKWFILLLHKYGFRH